MQILDRSEMKLILAGSTCLLCEVDDGIPGVSDNTQFELQVNEGSWGNEPPTSVCNNIYPGFEDGELTGAWIYC
jgi:hypothetical protein